MEEEQERAREGGVTAAGGRHNICCLNIIGRVEGHYLLPPDTKTTKYEHIIPALAEIELSDACEGLLILLNTAGGDVEAGLAIAELIAGMHTRSASVVLGGGHSIGVPLAVCADRSFIVPSAAMTIHPVRMNGPVIGVEQTAEYFRRMQRRIDGFVTANSHITPERLKSLMLATDEIAGDMGTVIDGKTAVGYGLIDRLGGISDAVKWLYDAIEREK